MNEKILWPGSTQLAPVPAVLIGCGNGREHKFNLITVAWTGIVCSTPPMLSISIRPERFSRPILDATGEFTVNLPGNRLAETLDWCGVVSGRDHDKFAERNLTAIPGSRISAPIVAECPLSLECKITRQLPLGSHILYLAEILAVQVSPDILDDAGGLDLSKAGPVAYGHGHYYKLGECLGHFGYSVRKKNGSKVRKPLYKRKVHEK